MIKLGIPFQITPGDTIIWKSGFTNHNTSNYTLSWAIRGPIALDVTATVSGNEYETTITAQDSATLTPGNYYFQALLTDGNGKRTRVGQGQVTVVADLASITEAYDGRSDATKMLDAVNRAIKEILDNGATSSYKIKEREATKVDLPDLIALRDKLKVEVARENAAEKIAQGLGDPRKLFIRFGG